MWFVLIDCYIGVHACVVTHKDSKGVLRVAKSIGKQL